MVLHDVFYGAGRRILLHDLAMGTILSIGGTAAGDVEHGAGGEGAILAGKPGDQRRLLHLPKRSIGIFDSMKSMCSCFI